MFCFFYSRMSTYSTWTLILLLLESTFVAAWSGKKSKQLAPRLKDQKRWRGERKRKSWVYGKEGRGMEKRRKERVIVCVFMLWSVSADRNEWLQTCISSSPWSVSMETLFLTHTHIHSPYTVFTVSMRFKWTEWKSRRLTLAFIGTSVQHRSSIKLPSLSIIRLLETEAIATARLHRLPWMWG